jgi:hypothetical protein
MATWADLETARSLWRDAPADDATLTLYLRSAQGAVIAYAPALTQALIDELYPSEFLLPAEDLYPYETNIPESWQLAQIFQARNIFNSAKVGPSSEFDGSGYGLSAFPLDWQVRQLVRPQRAVGAIA